MAMESLADKFSDHHKGIRARDPREAVSGALHKMLEDVLSEARVAAQALSPGAERVCQGVDAYLDACLRRPSLRVLLAALDGYPQALHILKLSKDMHRQQLAVDLKQMNVPLPETHARLISAMVRETHRAECDAGVPLGKFRDLLHQYVGAL